MANKPVQDWKTDYDIFDPAYIKDPFPVWDEIRQGCPVAHTERWSGSWMPTKYKDLFAIAQDIQHFSSREVLVAPPGEPRDDLPEEDVPEVLRDYDAGAPPITSDPPVHTWARRLLLPPFSIRSVAKYEPETRELCASLVEGFAGNGRADAAVDYAQQIPSRVIASMLGIPKEEAGMFTAVAVLGRVVLFVPSAISLIALPKVAIRASRGGDTLPLLWSTLAQTAALAGAAAAVLVVMTAGLGWSPVGSDISGAIAPLQWYLPAMVAFALVVAFVYYEIGCGNTRYIFALLVPGVVAQAALVMTFHGSLTVVAQVMFAVNGLLLAACLLLIAAPRAGALHLPRFLPRRTAPQAWRPNLPPNE